MYLVDTNIISEARRKTPEAVNWLRSVDPAQVYLSVITLGEIMRGIALKQKSDPQAAGHLAEWLGILRVEHGNGFCRLRIRSRSNGGDWQPCVPEAMPTA